MKSIVDKLLEKRGIKSTEELTPEERETFERWDKALSEEISVESITKVCQTQISAIENRWRSDITNMNSQVNQNLVIMHTIYSTLVNVITSPIAEKEVLEKYLVDLVAKE